MYTVFEYTVCNSESCSTANVEVHVGLSGSSGDGTDSGPQQNLLLAETNRLTHFNILDYPVALSGELKVQEVAVKPMYGTVMVLSGKQEMIYSPEKDYEGDDCKLFMKSAVT